MSMLLMAKTVIAKTGHVVIDHYPTIGLVAGIVTGVAAVGTAIWEGTKAKKVVEEVKEELVTFHEEEDELENNEEISDETRVTCQDAMNKNRIKMYGRFAWKFVKLVLLPLALEGVSLAFFITSHVTLQQRVTQLSATAAAFATALTQYRSNVVANYGEDADQALMMGMKRVVTEEEVVGEDGKIHVTQKENWVVSEEGLNPVQAQQYCFYFDEYNCPLTFDKQNGPWYNENQISGNFSQIAAIAKGQNYIFLNQILKVFNMELVDEGQDIGQVFLNPGDYDAWVKELYYNLDKDNKDNKDAKSGIDPDARFFIKIPLTGYIRPILKENGYFLSWKKQQEEVMEMA